MASRNPFSISIVLRHPAYTPEKISRSLSLKPMGSWSVGQKVVNRAAKWTFFYARLRQGDYSSKFPAALKSVAQFIDKNAAFWSDFMSGNGEVELILNHTISPQDQEGDKNFEFHLAPEFLGTLSARGIGLRVQGWQGRARRRTSVTRLALRKRRSR